MDLEETNTCCTLGRRWGSCWLLSFYNPRPASLSLCSSPRRRALSLQSRVSLFTTRNVRLTTQWKQQLHDRWPRPDRPIPSNVRSFFERGPDFFCSCEPVVIVVFIRGSNEEGRRLHDGIQRGSSWYQCRSFGYRSKNMVHVKKRTLDARASLSMDIDSLFLFWSIVFVPIFVEPYVLKWKVEYSFCSMISVNGLVAFELISNAGCVVEFTANMRRDVYKLIK